MKRNLYLYLFIFTALIALILYINGRKMQEALVDQVRELKAENNKLNTRIVATELGSGEEMTFTIKGNQEALNYFDDTNVDIANLEVLIFNELLELNATKGGNVLVPHISEANGFRINDIRVVNHKWVLANFSDTKRWGELLLIYNIDENNKVTFEVAKSILYNKYKP